MVISANQAIVNTTVKVIYSFDHLGEVMICRYGSSSFDDATDIL